MRIPYFVAGVYRTAKKLPADRAVVVIRRGKVIATCAVAAQGHVRPGQTTWQAQASQPQVAYFNAEDERISRALLTVLDTLAVFTPLVEYQKPLRRDRPQPANTEQAAVFYINLENLREADSRRLVAQMQDGPGYTATFGLAASLFTAFVAAHSESITAVRAGAEAAFLAPLPITLLPLTDEQRSHLTRLGLITIGQVAALPLSGLLTQFGKHGHTLYRLARGWDNRRVVAHRFDIVERAAVEFDDPIYNSVSLEAVFHTLANDLSRKLQIKGCMGRTLTLTLHLEQRAVQDMQITLRQPVSDPIRLAKTCLQLLGRFKSLRQGIVGIEVTMTNVVPFAGTQLDLFVHRSDQRERLEQAVASLTLRHDADCFLWITPADQSAQRIEQRYRLQSVGKRINPP